MIVAIESLLSDIIDPTYRVDPLDSGTGKIIDPPHTWLKRPKNYESQKCQKYLFRMENLKLVTIGLNTAIYCYNTAINFGKKMYRGYFNDTLPVFEYKLFLSILPKSTYVGTYVLTRRVVKRLLTKCKFRPYPNSLICPKARIMGVL